MTHIRYSWHMARLFPDVVFGGGEEGNSTWHMAGSQFRNNAVYYRRYRTVSNVVQKMEAKEAHVVVELVA